MKTFKLALLMILISTTGLYAQTAYNPFTQNINFQPEPTVAGFECGSTPNVEFTQGMTTSADATQWQTQPLIVTICVTGFEFNGTTAAAVVSGSYSTNFSWAFDSFAPNCLIGTQSQTIVGTGSNPLSPNPAASGEINVALSVPETSPVSTVLAVNVNLQVPGYMAQFNSTPDDNESTQTQTFCSLKIKGTVFRDSIPDTNVNGTPVDSGVTTPILCANLIDPISGDVVAISPVTSNGTYEFSNVLPNTVYDVRLTDNCGIVGQPGPTSSLPPGWDNTGEDGDGDGVGTDGGTPDGTTTVSVGNATVENVNFGIDAALPVRMGHFTVSEYNCTALVAWATLSEENVSHFEILRQNPGSTQFTKIGKVDAAGNSSSQKLYSFVDKEVEKSTEPYTYQIKTIDIDRSESFSNSRTLKLTCGGDEVSVQLFPNPATDNINLVYTTNENDIQLNVDLLDIAGRKIMSKSQIILKGTSVINMDVKSLAVGQYMIRYHNVEGNSTETLKFTKE